MACLTGVDLDKIPSQFDRGEQMIPSVGPFVHSTICPTLVTMINKWVTPQLHTAIGD